jgi:hypothetical protein
MYPFKATRAPMPTTRTSGITWRVRPALSYNSARVTKLPTCHSRYFIIRLLCLGLEGIIYRLRRLFLKENGEETEEPGARVADITRTLNPNTANSNQELFNAWNSYERTLKASRNQALRPAKQNKNLTGHC